MTRQDGAPGDRGPAPAASIVRMPGPARCAAAPVRNVFSYRTYQWLVDLDDVPRMPAGCGRSPTSGPATTWVTRLRASGRTWTAFLAARGIDLAGGQVCMLAHARVFGYVFNPLTVVLVPRPRRGRWNASSPRCTTPTGSGTATCCGPTTRGRAQVGKEFYVSPFHPVDGRYQMSAARAGPPARGHASCCTAQAGARSWPACAATRPGPAGGLLRSRRPAPVADRGGHRAASAGRESSSTPAACAGRAPDRAPPSGVEPGMSTDWRAASSQPARRRADRPGQRGLMPGHAEPDVARRCRRVRRGRGPRSPGPVQPGRGQAPAADRACPAASHRAAAARAGAAVRAWRCAARVDFYRRLGAGGLIGFGESYMAGDWDCDDLTGLLTVFARQVATPGAAPAAAAAPGLGPPPAASRRHPPGPGAATSAITTTCPTTCSRCSSTRP